MRPLDKGSTPLDNFGNPIAVNNYDFWRARLIQRIGYYCAYCNVPLSHSLQVEHVVPKNPPVGYVPGDALHWDNMLLACGPCNNSKDNTPINFNDYYFPEENNTLLPFVIVVHSIHADAAIVQEANGLTLHQQQKSKATIDLMSLENIDRRENVVDIRWKRRREAQLAVEAAYEMYKNAEQLHGNNLNHLSSLVAKIARAIGFFGIWFETFIDEPTVIRAMINPNIIPGTSQNCFDAANGYRPISRNAGNVVDAI